MNLPEGLVDHPVNGPAVYFLGRNGETVYIGSAMRYVHNRVRSHELDPEKEFDSAKYLSCDSIAEMRKQERHWIETIRPIHNARFNPDYNPANLRWGLTAGERRMIQASHEHVMRLRGLVVAAIAADENGGDDAD